ncbi:mediator of RNA polymerase II transcription subunit 17-like [Chenopodium quinoa]|uniref:mediator of RNA polymerase II transcription subunit 17-like n=1 Tax=Chenopodium quinoa TaxID=63459 RepID=UPI000B7753B2|nr:mediator of RNA polymerase II transcription subunit 17-like [Chenopodium quinoa]
MADGGDMEISLDKLPIKRLEIIEESGAERFSPEIEYEEKTVNLIRRIDFAWALEKDAKKQKKTKESSAPSTLQGVIENLRLAHQELSVIIDLINTVEANDAVTVAHMNRPKPLPNEALSDLAISAANKLQCFRHLSKYFKQSAKSLEHQIAREARFYGALIRLQQNWKVKWHRLAANAPGSDGFLIDLSKNTAHEQAAVAGAPKFSMVRVEHDSSGMLAVNLPKSSCRSFHFGFLDAHSGDSPEGLGLGRMNSGSVEESLSGAKKDSSDDDRIRETHTVLCNAHRAIFYEQVFELVSRESFNPSLGVNVTGIRENYLELSIKPGVSVFISLTPYNQEDQGNDSSGTQNVDDSSKVSSLVETKQNIELMSGHPNHITYEIYLQQLFRDEIYGKVKHQPPLPGKVQSNHQPNDAVGLVNHFCLSLAHRIFSSKVLKKLENLATKIPYLQLISQPTWHSRTSSWALSVKVPKAILNAQSQAWSSDEDQIKDNKLLFQTRVVVKDDNISIEGGGAPIVVGLFKSNPEAMGSKNKFNCDLVDLPMVLLLQIASEIICWLHEEALMVGIKTHQDFLCLFLELEQGETLSLVAHVDPKDALGCISWWLTVEDGSTQERKLQADLPDGESPSRRFLGHLSLDTLYSTLMDLVSVCTVSVNH